MDRYGIIYKITNKIDGKVYIGQTVFSFDERYKGDIEKNTHNDYLRRAIQKHGIENFDVEKECYIAETKEELDAMEKTLIAKFRSNEPQYGYNYLDGGHRGRHNAASKQKIGDAQRGEKNHMFGKRGEACPGYTREQRLCSFCGKSIKVMQCDLKRSVHHYCSPECRKKDHARIMTRSNSKIEVACCQCGKKLLKYPSVVKGRKYIFCSKECRDKYYKTLYTGDGNPNHKNGEKISGSKNGRAKKVLCVSTGEIYDCARDAERALSISRGLVGACCRGAQKTANGFKWKYID